MRVWLKCKCRRASKGVLLWGEWGCFPKEGLKVDGGEKKKVDGETLDDHSNGGEEVMLDLGGGDHGYQMFCGILDGKVGDFSHPKRQL